MTEPKRGPSHQSEADGLGKAGQRQGHVRPHQQSRDEYRVLTRPLGGESNKPGEDALVGSSAGTA